MPVTHCVTCARSMNSLSLLPSWRTHQWYVVVILGKLKSFLIDLKVEKTTTTIAKIIMIIETHRERVQSQCWVSEWEREKTWFAMKVKFLLLPKTIPVLQCCCCYCCLYPWLWDFSSCVFYFFLLSLASSFSIAGNKLIIDIATLKVKIKP